MEERVLRDLLRGLQTHDVSVEEAMSRLRDLPYQDLEFAKLDHHRPLRTGSPEVVLGRGKTPDQVTAIVSALKGRGHPVLVTKTDRETYDRVRQDTPEAFYNELASAIAVPLPDAPRQREGVVVVTAGTADLGVAEEAVLTAELMGSRVTRVCDVGVAGLHRLLDHLLVIRQARTIVVVAGMDAALAAVLAGLVRVPIIAVPTSAGYGSSFEGLAALLSMLNSCAPGVAVVNIDNGFGAGYMAAQINRMPHAPPDDAPGE